uniref:Uncharacterized protein n=1 Tax=Fundulus heteroclitus TaxID=8078 RepID=A0A3Q2QQW3_FUNHE
MSNFKPFHSFTHITVNLKVLQITVLTHLCCHCNLQVIYATQMPFDPEGVLGSINSVLMAFLGLQVIQFHFGEHGNYSLWMKNLNNVSLANCSLVTNSDPVNSNIRECRAHDRFITPGGHAVKASPTRSTSSRTFSLLLFGFLSPTSFTEKGFSGKSKREITKSAVVHSKCKHCLHLDCWR